MLLVPPHPPNRRPNLPLHPLHQFPVSGDERLLGFDFGDDFLLLGERWERDLNCLYVY